MKILIINTVPKNVGDLALVEGAARCIQENVDAAEISFLTTDIDGISRLSGASVGLDYARAITREDSKASLRRLALALTRRIPSVRTRKALYAGIEKISKERLKNTFQLLEDTDIVLSAPGGYLHDYYVTEHLIQFYRHVIGSGKRLVLLPQSCGPFERESLVRDLHTIDHENTDIFVRGQKSLSLLTGLGLKNARVTGNQDLGFLWNRKESQKLTKSGKIALCFREWSHGTQTVEKTVADGVKLVTDITDLNYDVCFISTCQGDPLYDDDSQMGLKIMGALPDKLKNRVEVNQEDWKTVEDCMDALADCDAFIGMRLHGCILAMCVGNPAFGLGYEPKTREIYSSVGIENYQCEFDKGYEVWGEAAKNFVSNIEELRPTFKAAAVEGDAQAEQFLSAIY